MYNPMNPGYAIVSSKGQNTDS